MKNIRGSKKIFISVGIVIAVCGMIAAIVIASMGNTEEKKLNKQLDLGNHYVDELDYEQAIAAYREAISIDPKSEEAYIGLANVYVEMGNYEEAIAILELGYEKTESEDLLNRNEEIAQILVENQKEQDTEEVRNQETVLSTGNDTKTEEAEESPEENNEPTEEITDDDIESRGETATNTTEEETPEENDQSAETVEGNTRIERVEDGDGSYWIYEYDSNGNLVKERYYEDGKLWDDYTYEYDSKGNKVRIVGNDYYGSWSDNYLEYDNNGNLIRMVCYGGNGSEAYSIIEYEYDTNGYREKNTGYNADGSIMYYFVTEYDSNGNMLRTISYNLDGTVHVKEYQ